MAQCGAARFVLDGMVALSARDLAMTPALRALIEEVLRAHSVLSLATLRPDGFPQANTVGYAHEGLTIYVGTGRDSQKLRNLRHCDRVSLTINDSAPDWRSIRGLSMGGHAALVEDGGELRRAAALMAERFSLPPGVLAVLLAETVMLRIVPCVISVLDYSKGFGHRDLVEV